MHFRFHRKSAKGLREVQKRQKTEWTSEKGGNSTNLAKDKKKERRRRKKRHFQNSPKAFGELKIDAAGLLVLVAAVIKTDLKTCHPQLVGPNNQVCRMSFGQPKCVQTSPSTFPLADTPFKSMMLPVVLIQVTSLMLSFSYIVHFLTLGMIQCTSGRFDYWGCVHQICFDFAAAVRLLLWGI